MQLTNLEQARVGEMVHAIIYLSGIHPFVQVSVLLRVVEQVEAERVRWRENVVQKVHSSFQVARLNQALQQVNTIRAKVLKTRKL